MADFDQLLADLQKVRDELEIKVQQGSKEAQVQWSSYEKKWETFAAEARLHESAKDVSAAARILGDELRAGFEGIKKALR